MGQYQQWLHYQEIDRQLRSELERLESELAHLQESMGVDAQEVEAAANGEIPQQSATISAHNTVIRLLALGMQGLPSTFSQQAGSGRNGFAHDIRAHTMGPVEEHGHVERAGSEGAASGKGRQAENGGILATPVMSQGWLPQSGPVEGTPFMERQTRAATPDSEMVLLPQDMQGFFDQHAQTDPQQEVPWWLRKPAANTDIFDASESLRTDELVRRWIERRKQLAAQAAEEADSATSEEGAADE